MTNEAHSGTRPTAYLSRRYHFSASHRLHSNAFTPDENRVIYGKCNNPHGHGHNYTVEVTMRGAVDEVTGMVCDLGELDAFAKSNLLDPFEATNLNTLDVFQNRVSTTENLTAEVYRIFSAFPGACLSRVRIEETSNNSFEYPVSGIPERLKQYERTDDLRTHLGSIAQHAGALSRTPHPHR